MTRAANINRQKATGAHYTPLPLGRFVARRILSHLHAERHKTLRVLDPACGSGALLEAFELAAREEGFSPVEYVGVEADDSALDSACLRMDSLARDRLTLVHGDFLEMIGPIRGQVGLWEPPLQTAEMTESFDVVIGNPPYVRTQVLGAVESRRLAERFNLSGRVDLYQAFLVAATATLRFGGILGIIVSNRFLSTVTGAYVRRYLASHYDVCEVIDLGDTKLFEAAVLPAVLIGRRKKTAQPFVSPSPTRFLRIYSAPQSARKVGAFSQSSSIYEVLDQGENGIYRVAEGTYRVSTGTIDTSRDTGRVWSLTTHNESQWVQQVRDRSVGSFQDIAQIRVGIKTTADSVFIRSDWASMPAALRPEPSLLLHILSHEDAKRWARKAGELPAQRVLYPHEIRQGRRTAIHLAHFPFAKKYLESHQVRLRARRYLSAGGRKWYEIWVPQDPAAWADPKVVFPDISPKPCFFLDLSGSIVNGNCYWITLRPGVPNEMLFLLLGVANSSVMTRFHDLAFGNKLYAGRRRYITQYVGKYPYPDPSTHPARELVTVVRERVELAKRGSEDLQLSHIESRIDHLVEKCFGINPE
ncbi:MAG: N-6 DNA methylase [Tepidisphaeraceae bacterium]|jgi:adenine-specific DNA-methyltransferase